MKATIHRFIVLENNGLCKIFGHYQWKGKQKTLCPALFHVFCTHNLNTMLYARFNPFKLRLHRIASLPLLSGLLKFFREWSDFMFTESNILICIKVFLFSEISFLQLSNVVFDEILFLETF